MPLIVGPLPKAAEAVLRGAVGRVDVVGREHRDMPVAELGEADEAVAHAEVVVVDDLRRWCGTGQCIADRDDGRCVGDVAPLLLGRVDRHDDDGVDPLVDHASGLGELVLGIRAAVDDDRAQPDLGKG